MKMSLNSLQPGYGKSTARAAKCCHFSQKKSVVVEKRTDSSLILATLDTLIYLQWKRTF